MSGIGWQRGLAALLMALGGLGALGSLAAPPDPIAAMESRLAGLGLREPLAALRQVPLYRQIRRESAWRAAARAASPGEDLARTLLVSAGALVLAWGILNHRAWATPLLAAGLLLWTVLYLLDLRSGIRRLGACPWLFAVGQGLNLLFLGGLLHWLHRDDRRGQPPASSLSSRS